MNQLNVIPHRKLLEQYLSLITVEAKKLKSKSGMPYCKARESVITNRTPFMDANSLAHWANAQEELIASIESDSNRLAALDYNSSYRPENHYYAFEKKVSMQQSDDSELKKLLIKPESETSVSHSTWLRFTKGRESEIRKPTIDVKVDSHVKCFNQLDKNVYIINTFEDFEYWYGLWGEGCVIAESVFRHAEFAPSVRDSMLGSFVVKNDPHERYQIGAFLNRQ
ncbi:MAG: hypothetical protein ABJH28_15875 [Paraglaciecola sp.]|uniref:hypothetical protein n=1 Tax=Paraglaciecola sp. TaxID=1920173 RepID=UPI003267F74A